MSSTGTTAPVPVPNAKATVNRQAKAVRVIEFMEGNPQIFGGRLSPDAVASYGPEVWALTNALMGEGRPMSPLTISMVVGMLTVRGL